MECSIIVCLLLNWCCWPPIIRQASGACTPTSSWAAICPLACRVLLGYSALRVVQVEKRRHLEALRSGRSTKSSGQYTSAGTGIFMISKPKIKPTSELVGAHLNSLEGLNLAPSSELRLGLSRARQLISAANQRTLVPLSTGLKALRAS